MAFNALAVVQVGEDPGVRHPSIDANLQIVPEALDGPFAAPIQVSMASVRRKVGNNWVTQLRTTKLSLQLWVTGSRVIIYCRNYDKGAKWIGFDLGGLAVAAAATAISAGMAANRRKGKALAGNVRYPWITKVGFAPRGHGDPEMIDIHYVDGTDPTKPECSLTLHLDNRVNANALARHIIDRVIAYRYSSGEELSDEVVEKFETLRTSGLRDLPEKGYLKYYSVPTWWHVPGGMGTMPDAIPSLPPGPRVHTTTVMAIDIVPPALEPALVLEGAAICAGCGSSELGTAFCSDCGQPIAV
jgi:hypothetical protein